VSVRRPAIFLDRDGTLTRESADWIVAPEQLELLPGAGQALRELERLGFLRIVVTNQSVVARGLLGEDGLARIHARLLELLAAEHASLDALYYCPHHESEGVGIYKRVCACRKPRPGLIERAAREHDVDLARSWVIGDALRDLEAGAALGVRGILVASGKGATEQARLVESGRPPAVFAADLLAACALVAPRSQTG
jgi:D-glycero-D-manno-heptose 1,7-bisphosphate phosphatase